SNATVQALALFPVPAAAGSRAALGVPPRPLRHWEGHDYPRLPRDCPRLGTTARGRRGCPRLWRGCAETVRLPADTAGLRGGGAAARWYGRAYAEAARLPAGTAGLRGVVAGVRAAVGHDCPRRRCLRDAAAASAFQQGPRPTRPRGHRR